MLDTIAHINTMTEAENIIEVGGCRVQTCAWLRNPVAKPIKLLRHRWRKRNSNEIHFISARWSCILGVSITTAYALHSFNSTLQWYSSGTTFSEYAEGGHYRMSKLDKRENIIMVFIHQITQPQDRSPICRLRVSLSPSKKVHSLICSLIFESNLPQRTGWK